MKAKPCEDRKHLTSGEAYSVACVWEPFIPAKQPKPNLDTLVDPLTRVQNTKS